jgi:transposase
VRFVGIDIGAEKHVVAEVNEASEVVLKPVAVAETAQGYAELRQVLGEPKDVLVAMEATGHYWRNLFAFLVSEGFAVALLNPLRTSRFAGEDLLRAKTDGVDAQSIARFAAQKRPPATAVTDEATAELKELVRFRDRMVQDFGDKLRQLHRLVDLGYPEFTGLVKSMDSMLATSLLHEWPTAQAFAAARPREVAYLRYDGRHFVGRQLAQQLVATAKTSVGAHHGKAYQVQVKCLCEDLDVLRRRIRELDRDIEDTLDKHQVGKLLTTIEGIGSNTAARIIAEVGDPARFRDGAALAAYVGVVPATSHSGKHRPLRSSLTRIGHAGLRRALWMPLLTAITRNPWLKRYYDRLRLRGKPPKVALIAALRKLLHAIHSVARRRAPFVPVLPPEGSA